MTSNKNDNINCRLAQATIDIIDWECTIHRNIAHKNLGCQVAVSNGISWFFEQVEFGIILEDDCIVDKEFFDFVLLNKYHFENSDKRLCIFQLAAMYQPGVKNSFIIIRYL